MHSFLNGNIILFLTGMGFSGINSFHKPLTEIDIADIAIIYGVFTLLLYLITFLSLLSYENKFIKLYSPKKIIVLSTYIGTMLFLVSSIAGHILFNGMVTLYLGVIIALPHWTANYNYMLMRRKINV